MALALRGKHVSRLQQTGTSAEARFLSKPTSLDYAYALSPTAMQATFANTLIAARDLCSKPVVLNRFDMLRMKTQQILLTACLFMI